MKLIVSRYESGQVLALCLKLFRLRLSLVFLETGKLTAVRLRSGP